MTFTTTTAVARRICLVTIHGVGFQQAPRPEQGIPGYADTLHARLARYLDASLLGDDPQRARTASGENGPVYVQSMWPVQPGGRETSESGLARLGSWGSLPREVRHIAWQDLTNTGQPIAHVALVYSHLEDQGPRLSSLAELSEDVAGGLLRGHYASIVDAARMALIDFSAKPTAPSSAADRALAGRISAQMTSSLRVRQEALRPTKRPRPARRAAQAEVAASSSGVWATILQLDHDVGAYLYRNELRERVRSFVREALLRLIFRDDVDGVVVNAHSQGTVVAFDVLRDLPPFAASRVCAFVTSGSPLRKYATLFNWGHEIGNIPSVPWINFWDAKDPVADPLAPPEQWRPGDPVSNKRWSGRTLFQRVDSETGDVTMVCPQDTDVDNLTYSIGGGLQAHNYWDNEPEVVQPLATLLRTLALPGTNGGGEVPAAVGAPGARQAGSSPA